MPQFTNKQKYEIIIRYELGYSSRQISHDMKINRKGVFRWLKRYNDTQTINRKHGSGRPRKTTIEQDKIIIKSLLDNDNIMIADDIRNDIVQNDINICKNTIINRLNENNIIYGKVIKKPLLTANHKQLRLRWAIENYKTDWTTVIFSDESLIKKNFKDKQWMEKDNKKVIQIVKYPISILVWGCIEYGGIGNIYCFNGIMNKEKYVNILKDNLLPYINNNYYFQFDNDPKHTSTFALSFLFDNNIKCISWWPPNSPDLNPIEHVWAYVKNKLKLEIIKNITELENNIKKIWNDIPYEIIYNLFSSMPSRIDEVISNNGGYTTY